MVRGKAGASLNSLRLITALKSQLVTAEEEGLLALVFVSLESSFEQPKIKNRNKVRVSMFFMVNYIGVETKSKYTNHK